MFLDRIVPVCVEGDVILDVISDLLDAFDRHVKGSASHLRKQNLGESGRQYLKLLTPRKMEKMDGYQ